MPHARFLPIHRRLSFALKQQRARAPNLERLRFLAAESHFTRLFLFLEGRFVENDSREIRRQRDFWESEGIQHEIAAFAQFEFLPDDGIKRHVRANREYLHVLHKLALGNIE